MAPTPQIPRKLKLDPFTVGEARAAGVSATALRGKAWRRVERGIYCWSELTLDPLKALGVWQRAYPRTLYAGFTAAWLHGFDVDPYPLEVIADPRSGARSRPGITVRRVALSADEIVVAGGLRATSVLRTLSDLCRRLQGVEALVLLDSALRMKLCDRASLLRVSPALARLAEPAESPMETRLRWLLLQAGLPRPQVQAPIPEARARADLYYPEARLVIEYDGGNHRERIVDDNRRQNRLVGAGYTVLRFTASDIYSRPEAVVAQVSAAAAACARRPAVAPR